MTHSDDQPGQAPADPDPDDDEWPGLAAELREVFDLVDPVPPEVQAVAYGALAWRDIDGDLAELVADSADAANALTGVRGATALPRLVSFEAPGVVVDMEIVETGRTRSLVGQIMPVGPATIEVQTPDDVAAVDADELGQFSLEDVSAGPVRLTCTLDDGDRRIVTSWTTL